MIARAAVSLGLKALDWRQERKVREVGQGGILRLERTEWKSWLRWGGGEIPGRRSDGIALRDCCNIK
jgi:hypothetical protein